MSVKIRLSYTEDSELEQITNLLKPWILTVKCPTAEKTGIKRAYFELKTAVNPAILYTINSDKAHETANTD